MTDSTASQLSLAPNRDLQLQGSSERYSPPNISAIDLLKEGFNKPSNTSDNFLAVGADGKLIDSNALLGALDGSPKWGPLSKAGFNKEESSILQGGFNLPVLDNNGSKPEKGILATVKEQFTGKPLAERMEDTFGNTVEGKIKQKVAMSKMTPEEQEVLLRQENYDSKSRVFMTRADLERDAKVFEKFNKLVDQEKAKLVDGVVSSMTPAERAALKQEMKEMKNNATIDFQTGKVDLPPPGKNVKLFYERLAQKVLKPSDQ